MHARCNARCARWVCFSLGEASFVGDGVGVRNRLPLRGWGVIMPCTFRPVLLNEPAVQNGQRRIWVSNASGICGDAHPSYHTPQARLTIPFLTTVFIVKNVTGYRCDLTVEGKRGWVIGEHLTQRARRVYLATSTGKVLYCRFNLSSRARHFCGSTCLGQ